MRTRTTAAALIAAGLLATLTACGSSDDQEGKTVDTPKPPAYTVANKNDGEKRGSVDLIVPDATIETAKAAIHDYAKSINGPLNYSITVVRDDTDKTYVCMGEWAKDEQASQIYTGGRIKGDTWPAILMNCPDPKG